MRLEIDAPVNGRIHKATVNVRDDDGTLLFTDMADLRAMVEREKLANRIAGKLRKDPAELKQKLEESWTQTLNDREQQKASAQKTAADPTACNEAIILDAFPDEIRRPLCLVGGHAYAATWLSIQVTVRQGVAANGALASSASGAASGPTRRWCSAWWHRWPTASWTSPGR